MLGQHFLSLALAAGGASALTQLAVDMGSTPAEMACKNLSSTFGSQVSFTVGLTYSADNADFWSADCALGPACIFQFTSAQDLSAALTVVKDVKSPFALKGGGHMPIPGVNNINETGVLFSSTAAKNLSLSADGSVLTIGPGNRWGDVYKYLEPHDLMIVGGRLGIVGVPGLVLGGGMSFLSWEYGWSASNLAGLEVVLANGDIVYATNTNEYSDLFWAMRGGGNSFGMVTAIDMITVPAPSSMIGAPTFGNGSGNTQTDGGLSKNWLSAIYNFAVYGAEEYDFKSSVTPTANWMSGDTVSYDAIMAYFGNSTNPPALANFTSDYISSVKKTDFKERTMYEWCQEDQLELELEVDAGFRARFYYMNTYADLEVMEMIHDLFFSTAKQMLGDFKFVDAGLTPMPIPKKWFEASRGFTGGDPMDIDPNDGPQIWYELSMIYSNDAADDEIVNQFYDTVNTQAHLKMSAMGKDYPLFIYLNDADEMQPVFEGYPQASIDRLKTVRSKYDPDRIFTDLMPGGWKIADFTGQGLPASGSSSSSNSSIVVSSVPAAGNGIYTLPDTSAASAASATAITLASTMATMASGAGGLLGGLGGGAAASPTSSAAGGLMGGIF